MSNGKDVFGILKLNASVGREWLNKWDAGPRSWKAAGWGNEVASRDPMDSETFLYCPKGNNETGTFYENSCSTSGNGIMKMQGPGPALFVKKSGQTWKNVEITIYVKKIGRYAYYPGTDSVMKLGGLSQHDLAYKCNLCGYGYYADAKDTGREMILKELLHITGTSPDGYSNRDYTAPRFFSNGFPTNKWIGYKFTLQVCDNGQHVKLRYYRDMTDGLNGGDWKKILEHTDIGGWGVSSSVWNHRDSSTKCSPSYKPNTSPTKILKDAANSVFFRIYHMAVYMKKASVREIAPLP